MNWSATTIGGGGIEIKPLSREEALTRQDEIRQPGWFAPNGPLSDADILALQVLRCSGRRLQGVPVAETRPFKWPLSTG
jgi:hypothetical protein